MTSRGPESPHSLEPVLQHPPSARRRPPFRAVLLAALLVAGVESPAASQHAPSVRATAHFQIPVLQEVQQVSEETLPDGTRRVSVQLSSNQSWYLTLDAPGAGGWQWRIVGTDVAFRSTGGASVIALAGDAVHRQTLVLEVRGTGAERVRASMHPLAAKAARADASALRVAVER